MWDYSKIMISKWGSKPYQTLSLLVPCSWTSQPLRNKCLLFISHTVYDISLQQPGYTTIVGLFKILTLIILVPDGWSYLFFTSILPMDNPPDLQRIPHRTSLFSYNALVSIWRTHHWPRAPATGLWNCLCFYAESTTPVAAFTQAWNNPSMLQGAYFSETETTLTDYRASSSAWGPCWNFFR